MNWLAFLNERGVDYSDSGSNVSQGNVVVRCPFCSDNSQHMSISTEGKGWHCWKCKKQGKNPVALMVALTGITVEHARRLSGQQINISDDLLSQVTASMNVKLPKLMVHRKPTIPMPKEFRPIDDRFPASRPYIRYLKSRGYVPERLTDLYGLRYCTSGAYEGRIIIPVKFDHKLVGWTARTIWPNVIPRYKVLSDDQAKARADGYPPAPGPITRYLLFYDELLYCGCRTIYLVEGPFDALRIRYISNNTIAATCFFTSQPSNHQIGLLHELLPRFKERYLLLDRGAEGTLEKVAADLISLRVKPKLIPSGVKDPGELKTIGQLLKPP